jgi:hypothetical protein
MPFDSVTHRFVIVLTVVMVSSMRAMAQTPTVEVGGHVSVLRLGELDTTDAGVGPDVVWRMTPLLAIDGALTWFRGSNASTGGSSRHARRTLGLTGLRAGISAGSVDVFARARGGFLRFSPGPPTVCIAIFPVPLVCQLAGGYTAFAADVGGGASVGLIRSGRLRASVEAGDLMVRYGFMSFRPNGTTSESFISHNLLVSIGAAWRF